MFSTSPISSFRQSLENVLFWIISNISSKVFFPHSFFPFQWHMADGIWSPIRPVWIWSVSRSLLRIGLSAYLWLSLLDQALYVGRLSLGRVLNVFQFGLCIVRSLRIVLWYRLAGCGSLDIGWDTFGSRFFCWFAVCRKCLPYHGRWKKRCNHICHYGFSETARAGDTDIIGAFFYEWEQFFE